MPKITFQAGGQTYQVPPGTRYLDFCQEEDAPQNFGCTVGSCGTCVLVLVQGAGNVPPATEEELETVRMCTDADARLGCQLVVNGDIIVAHLD